MAPCVLTEIKPVLILARILGLNWFEIQHHHSCSPSSKTCQVRYSHCNFGSILNAIIFLITVFSTFWVTLNVWNFVSAFFIGVEQFTYSIYIIMYYWQTPPLLLIPRFTYRPLPKLWERILNISAVLNTLKSKPVISSKSRRLGVTSWILAIVTLVQGVTYLGFFLYVIHALCYIMRRNAGYAEEGNCYAGVFGIIGINTSSAAFFLVCTCPQVISIMFFLHCFVLKRLLDQLRHILQQTLKDNSSIFTSEWEKCQQILQLRLLYTELGDVVRKLGNCFGLQLLTICISSILSLTVAAYIMFSAQMSDFPTGQVSGGTPLLILLACQLYFAVYTLTFLLAGGNMVKNGGDKVHQTLHRASHVSQNSTGSTSEIQFQITMFQNSERTIISVYGITTVEMKILTAILANVITYFLILVQLKISFELTSPQNRNHTDLV